MGLGWEMLLHLPVVLSQNLVWFIILFTNLINATIINL